MISVVNMKNIRGKFHGKAANSFVMIMKKNEKKVFPYYIYNIIIYI